MMMVSFSEAQETEGIQFEHEQNWDAVLAKAKAEHKYVFVDCYATWCGPCKAMDQSVFLAKEVGSKFNRDYISVKIQMDQTQLDNNDVKNWYDIAKNIQNTYRVNAYPTFLFFDPEGRPVHKSVGYKSAEDFIKLGAEAMDPKKQYYAILRNFKPGKLDTAVEKGFARSFGDIDSPLGGKIAFDYLHRIPKSQLWLPDNLDLTMEFIYNVQVRKLATDIINLSSEASFLDQKMLVFVSFVGNVNDKGFRFIYTHEAEVDTVMHNPDWTKSTIAGKLYRTDLEPLIQGAEETGTPPDFDSLRAVISKWYDSYYGERVIQDGKFRWYGWLVHDKKRNEFWPQLIEVDIEKLKREWDVQMLRNFSATTDVNNICYTDIFQHSDDSSQLKLAVKWLKELTEFNSENADALDTYACLLYKTGNIDQALKVEDVVLQFCMKHRKAGTHTRMLHTTLAIQRMWNGEKIWEEKEFQE